VFLKKFRKRLFCEVCQNYRYYNDSSPEVGPTGTNIYYFDDDIDNGIRTYWRRQSSLRQSLLENQGSNSCLEDNALEVFQINFNLEQLGPMSLSVDEKYVARVRIPIDHQSKHQVIIREIASGKDFILDNICEIENICSVEFGPILSKEIHSVFITTTNTLGRPYKVYACTFHGSFFSRLSLLLTDENEKHFVDVQRTKGCHYVTIQSTSKTSNEIHLVGWKPSEVEQNLKAKEEFVWTKILVLKRQNGVKYYVDCGADSDVFLMVNQNEDKMGDSLGNKNIEYTEQCHLLGKENSVFQTCVRNLPLTLSSVATLTHIASSSLYFIEDMDIFKNYLTFYERSSVNAQQRIRVISRSKSKNERVISIPKSSLEGECQSISPCGNINYNADSLLFITETPLIPPVTYEYNFSNEIVTRKCDEVNVNEKNCVLLHEKDYASMTVTVSSFDGIAVPMTLVYQKNNRESDSLDCNPPFILTGYGCYGECQNLHYDPSLLPLLKRGFVLAYCHGRGGGDLGNVWYQAGRLYNKNNAIQDYLACAKSLYHGEIKLSGKDSTQNNHIQEEIFVAAKAYSAG